MNRYVQFCGILRWAVGSVSSWLVLTAPWSASAQTTTNVPNLRPTPLIVQGATATSDRVTITVQDADIRQVLDAFRRQTGRNLVIGPNVSGPVNVRLSNVPWERALQTILSPYGFEYVVQDDVIIVMKSDPTKAAAPAPEPTVVKVFQLKYLDASDLEDVIKPHLSPSGSMTVLRPLGQYWEPEWSGGGGGGGRGGSGSDAVLARGRRTPEKKEVVRSKRFVVRDTASVVRAIEELVAQLDVAPQQVLIEAKFVEVSSDVARDLGFEWDVERTFLNGRNVQRAGGILQTLSAAPRVFPNDVPFSRARPFNTGADFYFQQLTDVQFSILMHLLEDSGKADILSSPRIMTLNNQEARIVVGEKFPILTYQNTVPAGGALVTQMTLEYYEKIGIQLAVVPQICEGGYVSMIVRPSVSDRMSLVETYPVLSTREAETQIMVKSGSTVVIGGLVRDRERTEEFRVPLLGDIPLVGALFRRQSRLKDKVDLLIFLTATIMGAEGSSASSTADRGQ